MAALPSCGGTKPTPDLGTIRQPSGLAIAPDGQWLFVANGNWDRAEAGSTLTVVDLDTLHAALSASIAAPDSALSASQPCRRVAEGDDTVECLPRAFIDPDGSVVFGDGLGNIAIDAQGEPGRYRLLMPQRAPAALAWTDVVAAPEGVLLDCGQDAFGSCDDAHQVRSSAADDAPIAPDPSRVTLDDQGFRLAYLPHLLGGELSLIDLDGDVGPELTAHTRGDFYESDPFDGFDVAGGFAVAARACNPDAPPSDTFDCTRPLLYTTHRYWPGIKSFTIKVDERKFEEADDLQLVGIGAENVVARPIMGDLAFEDPTLGDRLLLVQTTPGSLVRVDTSIDPELDAPRNALIGTAPLCNNPNVLAVHRPANEEWLALVSCLSDGVVAVVGLATFTVIANIQVGAGPNEMAIDTAREQLYVANAREDTISIVSLDRQSPLFLREWARLGLGAGSR